MNEGAVNVVDHMLLEGVPIRQWVLTLPHPLRYPFAFDGAHLGRVLRLFTNAVASLYRRHHPDGKTGVVTVIQRASSRYGPPRHPHFHTLFLDGVYLPGPEGGRPVFEAAPKPAQADVEVVVQRAEKRILRCLEKRGLITFAAASGDGEVNAHIDESLGNPIRLFPASSPRPHKG